MKNIFNQFVRNVLYRRKRQSGPATFPLPFPPISVILNSHENSSRKMRRSVPQKADFSK